MVFVVIFVVFWLWVVWQLYFRVVYRPRKITGDVVLITGGGSGIGRQMAHRFAKLGATIVLWDVNKEGLDKVSGEIKAAGGNVSTYVVDVTARATVYETAKKVGKVDILINNAGIVTGKTILECPDALMEKTVQVNTIAHFWTIKAFLPAMLASNKGHIVTIASAAGLNGVAGLVDYCASKFGAVGIAESLMLEMRKLKSKVRSTVICPYYINTGMFTGAKSKYPLLFPILDEDWVADRIVLGIRRGEEHINMPHIVNSTPIIRMLPTLWMLNIFEFLGVSDSMDEFKGRK